MKAHCLCHHNGQTIAFDCYVSSFRYSGVRHPSSAAKAPLRGPSVSGLARAVEDLRYGFAVIVDNKRRRKAVMDAVAEETPESVPAH